MLYQITTSFLTIGQINLMIKNAYMMHTLNRPPIDNYLKKVLPIGLAFPPGTCLDAYFSHDDWCAYMHGGRCNCDPDVLAVPRTHASL